MSTAIPLGDPNKFVVDGPLVGKKYLLLDRDTKYCAAFRQMPAREGFG